MAKTYSATARIVNGFSQGLSELTLKHRWSGDPGQNKVWQDIKCNSSGLIDSNFEILSGSDGYDYWALSFTYGSKIYEMEEVRCSLNTLDINRTLIFYISADTDDDCKLTIVMNSGSRTFSISKS